MAPLNPEPAVFVPATRPPPRPPSSSRSPRAPLPPRSRGRPGAPGRRGRDRRQKPGSIHLGSGSGPRAINATAGTTTTTTSGTINDSDNVHVIRHSHRRAHPAPTASSCFPLFFFLLFPEGRVLEGLVGGPFCILSFPFLVECRTTAYGPWSVPYPLPFLSSSS